MSEQRDEFAYLGQHARTGGPLQPPFDEATTANDVAIAIHAVAGRRRPYAASHSQNRLRSASA